MRVFISHSSKDAELAEKVCAEIEKNGHGCFLAPRDIRSGHEYAEEIINGIDGSDVVLLFLSQMANDSPHVLREIERAVSKKIPIIVYKLEEVKLSKSMEYFLMTHQWLNSKEDKGFSGIIRHINDFNAHSAGTAQPVNPDPAVPENKAAQGKSARNRQIMICAALAVILAAGVITGFCLANRSPADIISPSNTNSTEAPSEPSASVSDPAPADEISQPQSKTEEAAETQQPESAVQDNGADIPTAEDTSQTAAEPSQPEEEPIPVIQPEPVTDKPQTSAEQPPENVLPEITAAQVELGSSIYFGTYYGEPIEWRVLRISEDGAQAVVIADSILTMKAYDAAEGGTYNIFDGVDYWMTKLSEIPADIQRLIRGDNRWEYSNIRTWLNSERENVVYSDQAPTHQAMTEKRNGYSTEPGFLNGFTKEERSAIVETEILTNGAATKDRVFLLSSDELDWLAEADVSFYAEPTPAAVENDRSGWYKADSSAYEVDDYFWWLRDANPDNSCECMMVNISYTDKRLSSRIVGTEGFGIRPALTLDLTSEAVKKALEE